MLQFKQGRTGMTAGCRRCQKLEKKKPDKFKHEWLLNPRYWSVCYVESYGFFCVLCKKHNMKNAQNKSQTFIETPSKRMKEDSLKIHMASAAHSSAVEADLLQRMSAFHHDLVEKNEVQRTVLKNVFATAFFLMKEFIANRKLIPLISFMEKVLGISQLKHFSHRSQGSVREIYLTLGDTVKQNLLKRARNAKSFGLLMDEVTDISVSSQLISFIQFWDDESSSMTTMFLSSQNVLEDFSSCNSEAITELVKKELSASDLDISKLMGLSTDGASVMIGKTNGVAAKLRQSNDKLLNMHCVCHRLALGCTDSCQELKFIKEVEDVLRQLWYYFHNSPKKTACFLKCQIELKKVSLSHSEKTKKLLAKRLKKACQTRWLSFDASVTAALQSYEAILLSLQEIDDATAIGLISKLKSVKFLGALYILNAILPVLSSLSKQFQAGNFHFSMIRPAVNQAISTLATLKETGEPLQKLQADIDSFTRISDDLQLRKDTGRQLETLLANYVDALTTNIKDRLGNSPKVIEAYAIFDPLLLPSSDEDSFKEYGKVEVKIIANHFFPGDEDKMTKLLCQWSQVKFFLSGRKLQIPAGNQSSTFFMSFMLKNKGIFHPSMFEELLFVAEVGLSLPCSNAWPERGGSVINITKTKFRNRLSNEMLNALMQVSVNAPESVKCNEVVKSAVANWLKQKPRKKLKKVTVRAQPQINVELSHPMEGHEELVQSDHGENDAEAEGTIPDGSLNENVEGGAEEAAAVATAIGLPEPDYDSAIESDCGSDDDF